MYLLFIKRNINLPGNLWQEKQGSDMLKDIINLTAQLKSLKLTCELLLHSTPEGAQDSYVEHDL